jgi:catechol 2,3-dioxygenase-like lactoylglutathione lyase family enzyme
MAVPRTLGLVLIVAVGLAFVVFGVDDVLLSELPPMHRAYAERLGLELPEPVAAMVLAVFAGQGGFFFGSGLALLLLAAGPVRRGEPFACAAALALVVFGNAGIILHLHRLGAPFGLLATLLALGALGVAACRAARPRAEASGAVHHVDVTARDVARSTAFYDGVLPLLGFRRGASAPEGPTWAGAGLEVGLQPARSAGDHDRYAPGLHHLAFSAPSRAAVDSVHERLAALGARVLDAPADYPQYAPGYYAVFFADPDGIKLEYVFTPRWPS